MLLCESMVLSCSMTSLVKSRYEITNSTISSGSAVSLRLRLAAAFAMASIFSVPGCALIASVAWLKQISRRMRAQLCVIEKEAVRVGGGPYPRNLNCNPLHIDG